MLLEGLSRLFMILRRGSMAEKAGHGWLTVAQAICDSAHDTGFLLQGVRIFSGMPEAKREKMLRYRLLASALYLAAAGWIIAGYVIAVFLAARGVLGPTGIWLVTLAPMALFVLLGLGLRVYLMLQERALTNRARQQVEKEIEEQVAEWGEKAEAAVAMGVLGRGPRGEPISLRATGIAGLVLCVIVLLPLVTYSLMGITVPVSLPDYLPRFQGIQEKGWTVQHMRAYRLPADESVTPLQAGQALHNLNFVGGRREQREMERAPAVYHDQAWQFGRSRARGIAHPVDLLLKPTSELTEREWEVLRREAANPAHAEFAVLGRAGAADFTTAMYELPIPASYNVESFPVPRFQGISDGAKSHVAVAAYELHSGRPRAAEERLREVISTGFLMMDEHQTLIGNLIGIVIIGVGRDGLEALYRATGRTAEAQAITEEYGRRLKGMPRAAPRTSRSRVDLEEHLEQMTLLAGDEDTMRGLRWELFAQAVTWSPFLNLHTAVYGPGEEYEAWVGRIRDDLVRYPGEEDLFDVYQYGWLVSRESLENPPLLARLFSLSLGKSRSPGSFAALLYALPDR
jgi:hypothetical protein